MALVVPTQCEVRWYSVLASFDKQHEKLLANNPDVTEMNLVRMGLVKIGQLIQTSPQINGNGDTWKRLVEKAGTEKNILCKHLDGKALFTGMLRLYAAIPRELTESLLPEHIQGIEDAPHSRRRKRNSDSYDGSSSTTKMEVKEAKERSRPLPVYQIRGQ
jgi:adenylate kinase